MMGKAIDDLYDYSTQLTDERRCEIAETIELIQTVVRMCFDDSCSMSGKIKKKTALELIKYTNN